MNCKECLNLLDDYVGNELEVKSFETLEAHLTACQDCAFNYKKLKLEQNIFEQYLSKIEAAPTLWTGLEVRLEKAQSPKYRQPFAYLQNFFANIYPTWNLNSKQIAGFFIIAAAGIVALIGYNFSSGSPEKNSAILQENSNRVSSAPKGEEVKSMDNSKNDLKDVLPTIAKKNQPVKSANKPGKSVLIVPSNRTNQFEVSKMSSSTRRQPNENVVQKVERQYKNAIAVLTRDIERRRKELPSAALSQTETVLTDLDRTIENTRRAVREQPQNPAAVQYMTAAYEKKVELLRNILTR